MPRKPHNPKSVSTLKHRDKRVNIPTEELCDFVEHDEKKPKTIQCPGQTCAHDPSLDFSGAAATIRA